MEKRYEDIMNREETAKFNSIDKARALLNELLDDDNASLNSYCGEVVQAVVQLLA